MTETPEEDRGDWVLPSIAAEAIRIKLDENRRAHEADNAEAAKFCQEITELVIQDATTLLKEAEFRWRHGFLDRKSPREVIEEIRGDMRRWTVESAQWEALSAEYEKEKAKYLADHGGTTQDWLEHLQAEVRREKEAREKEERRYQKAWRTVAASRAEERARWAAEEAATPEWVKWMHDWMEKALLRLLR